MFQYVVSSMIDLMRYCRGFDAKSIKIDEFEWSYVERNGNAGDTEPVVFLHGFSSIKESWLRVAAGVDKKYKILLPDLPGHGRTLPMDPGFDYSADAQAQRLHNFIEKTIPPEQKIHLIGCSMGGMIAGTFSAMYPERVRSLTMICPAGLSMPNKSDAYTMLETKGKNLLLAHNVDDIMEMSEYLSHQHKKFPRMLASLIAKERAKQIPILRRIAADLLVRPTILEDHLELIQARTMVLWGRNDRILDISSMIFFDRKLQAEKYLAVIDDCGHILQHEKYQECITAINIFIDGGTPTDLHQYTS